MLVADVGAQGIGNLDPEGVGFRIRSFAAQFLNGRQRPLLGRERTDRAFAAGQPHQQADDGQSAEGRQDDKPKRIGKKRHRPDNVVNGRGRGGWLGRHHKTNAP